MKKILTLFLAAAFAATAVYAQENVHITEITEHSSDHDLPRTQIDIPFECFVDEAASVILLECNNALGNVSISLIYEESGCITDLSTYINSGINYLPVLFQDGTYTIILTLCDGRKFRGVFLI